MLLEDELGCQQARDLLALVDPLLMANPKIGQDLRDQIATKLEQRASGESEQDDTVCQVSDRDMESFFGGLNQGHRPG